MTDLNLTCAIDADDQICATRSSGGKRIEFTAWADGKQHGVEVYADTDKARTFARGILALADEIDGGEVKAEPARRPQVGDRVRVVKDDPYTRTGQFVGRTGTVRELNDDGRTMPYRVRLDDSSGTWDDSSWWCADVELVDEVESVEPPSDESAFASHVEQAKTLLAGTTHNGADVIRLAEILADRA
ncbi:transcription termination/antitermination protein NusG [Streptomyces scabiei]|uniref:hypothetical protein n=1 Tax=Streptomyces scabiei TaxID=1930 RepID=UPI0029B33240|nr:hypothetical protein [Streptomyces scabiei]MDX2794052.1 hypothetical protein [Streptomyces scabiei]